MDFTSLYPGSHSSTCLSPDGSLILAYTGSLLILRDAVSFQVIRSWSIPSSHSSKSGIHLAFSYDSAYILVVCRSTATASVYSVHDSSEQSEPVVVVQAGTAEGLHSGRFITSPNTGKRYLATWAASQTRMTSYDLESGDASVILSPKHGVAQGWGIQPCGDAILAILERRNGKDALALYDLEGPFLIRYVPLATVDAADLSWSPCGSYIVVLDNVMQIITHILSASGRPIATYDPDMHGNTSALNLGSNQAIWHPSGEYLLLCRADDSLHILDTQSWRRAKIVRMPWSQWGLPRSSSDGQPRARLLHHREPVDWLKPVNGQEPAGIVDFTQTSMTDTRLSAMGKTIPPAGSRAVQTKATTQLGLLHSSVSSSGRYIALVSAAQPRWMLVCKFNIEQPASLRVHVSCVIECNQPIQGIAWQPSSASAKKSDILAIATGEKSLILWRETSDAANERDGGSVEAVGVPTKSAFHNNTLAWSPDGSSVLLQGESTFCLAYPHEA